MFRVMGRCLILLLIAGCAGQGQLQQAERAVKADHPEQAVAILEAQRDQRPRSIEVRDALGEAYYRSARKALEEGRNADYERNLAAALDEWVESLRLAPESSRPHVMMAIVSLHQGRLDDSIVNLKNALRLSPRNPMAHSNLAEAYVYQGDFRQARRYIGKARKGRLIPGHVEVIEALAAWKTGDMVEARDLFASAYSLNPEVVVSWNEAPMSDPIHDFNDFTESCCSDIACGPYMESACRRVHLDATQRQVSDDLVRKELLLEMERRRKLDAIYRDRRDLKIEVEPAEPVR
jgi:Flp pilus assembly protein TadD